FENSLRKTSAFVLAVALLCNATAQQKATAEITYIANEGVMISSAGKKVLIDVLLREGLEEYERVPSDQLEKIETGRAPFDKVSVALVSHFHKDHFDARSAARFLENNPQSTLASSTQVVEAVRKEQSEKIRQRIHEVMPDWRQRIQRSFDGVEVTFLRIRHTHQRNYGVHNLGHIIRMGGKKFLHIGDAEVMAENFIPLGLEREGIDVALVPFWFLISDAGRAIVNDLINPRHIVALHIPLQGAEEWARQIKAAYPQAMICAEQMQKRSF
ncbi:MAG: MBL fold metallo-hydrolase, partial [Acidobacteriota bacterium]